MEEDQELKHICKFCNRSFPCGRSLGGHMRSHLINTSSDQTQRNDKKLQKKKLPHHTNGKNNANIDGIVVVGGRISSNKTRKLSKSIREVDTLLQRKVCKECGKSFQSWKALFGHMKSHSLSGRMENSVEEDSRDSLSGYQKIIMDSYSDNEAATPFCKKKRSDRLKRCTSTANFSPCVSDIDQQEQEEVALSLIMLSRDVRKWDGMHSFDSSDNNSELLEAKNYIGLFAEKGLKTVESLKFKEMRNGKVDSMVINPEEKTTLISRNGLKTRTEFRADEKFKKLKNVGIGCNESEVDFPKNLIKKSEMDLLEEQDFKKNKRKFTDSSDSDLTLPVENYKFPFSYNPFDSEDFKKNSKFLCTICKRAFPSYQALGGHRASHKKFKGCCAPRNENTENSPIRSDKNTEISDNFAGKAASGVGFQKGKDHECPICFKIFPSGQALGGHKRSHLISHQTKISHPSTACQKPIPEIRDFLDLNMPAPVDEECSDFKNWWIGISQDQEHKREHNHGHENEHKLLLGLIPS